MKVLPSQPNDVAKLLMDGLRKQDVEELAAMGRQPGESLEAGLRHCGVMSFTMHVDGVPAGMFGAGPTDKVDVGIVWMLGTDRLLEAKREMVYEAPYWVDLLNKVYPTLTNYVDARNSEAIKWLEMMGFEFPTDDVLRTSSGVVFRRFQRCVHTS